MSTAATTGVQLALDCDPTWPDTVSRTLARIEQHTLQEPANPCHRRRSQTYRRVHTIRLTNQDYL